MLDAAPTEAPQTETVVMPRGTMALLMRYMASRPVGEPNVLPIYALLQQCKPLEPENIDHRGTEVVTLKGEMPSG